MKQDQFYGIAKEYWKDCMKIMKSKGIAYSGRKDKFGNFKRIAKNLGLTPYQVWYVYFAKHLDSLNAWLREEYQDSEPIEGRIKDLINYLLLLGGMIEEEKEPQSGTFIEYDADKYPGGIPPGWITITENSKTTTSEIEVPDPH